MRRISHDKNEEARAWLSDPYTQKKAAELRKTADISLRALIGAAAVSDDPKIRVLHEEYVNLIEQARFFSGGPIAEDYE